MDSLRMIAKIAEDEASSAKALEDYRRILELKREVSKGFIFSQF
jgi:hypothetical protein